jgi:molybdopterin-containing oxidoreductase family iron-sulfur binding subunit
MSSPTQPLPLDLDALRQRLASAQGPQFWRSLEEIAETPEFQAYLENEFTAGTSEWTDPVSRRRVLQLLGASLGLAGLTACTRQPPEKIVPYVQAPEQIVPGRPLYFATALTLGGYARGVLVESHMGRPTKVEGNPDHPDSLGATDPITQAEPLTFYDPDRSQAVVREGRISSWVNFVAAMANLRESLLANKGSTFRILTETITSPALAHMIRGLLAELPGARWHQYDPVSRDNVREGARLAFGEVVNPVYNVDRAAVILSLDSWLLHSGPGSVRYAKQFSTRREAGPAQRNRLYAIESFPTPTGAIADHRLPLAASEIEAYARALAAALGLAVPKGTTKAPEPWIKAVAADLLKHKGASLVVAGDHLPPVTHAVAHAINQALGNAGSTVVYTEPIEAEPMNQFASIRELAADMANGRVETLLTLGGNPIYNAPMALGLNESVRLVRTRIHVGLYDSETSARSHWHVPEAHALESWGDCRAFDGTVTIQQPLIAPLYGSKTQLEVLATLAGKADQTGHDLIREYWRSRVNRPDFDAFWEKALHDGIVPDTAAPVKNVTPRADLAPALAPSGATPSGIELQIRPDPNIWDGRYANNAWLQELPRPVTLLTWDNAAYVAPATAQRIGVRDGDVVDIKSDNRSVKAPVAVLPGHPPDAVTIHLGYGRWRAGKVGTGVGFNANLIRSADRPWAAANVQITKTGDRHELATTQLHSSMEGRNLVRVGTFAEFEKDPQFVKKYEHGPKEVFSLYPEFKYEGYSWGMTINLNTCIGCNACTIACQAENNIPVVGKQDVLRGREMHWIRVDRYYKDDLDNPEIYNQPVPCMHCDHAPCEVVCPVAATSHSAEGLNEMTYNRCIGTRYCSNNCPYKVRRFNFFLYSDWDTRSLHGLRNPDVTVRSRGVMEKCTYCVQRINVARIDAEREGRRIRDGEVITACQSVCPVNAIVFGDMNDPKSKIAQTKKDPRNYGLLTELNTKPRTTYLARLRNPNPELEPAAPAATERHGA